MKRRYNRKANKIINLKNAGCETIPEKQPLIGRKIIPFPGVSLSETDNFQNELDGFLREIGYIE